MNARLISRRAGCWARCCTGTDAIGELDDVDIVDDVATSYVHRYHFDPTQEHKIFVGKDAVDDYGNGQRNRLCDAQRERTCTPHQRERKERSVRERCCRVGSRGHRADRPAAAQPGAAQTVQVLGTAAAVLTRPRRTAARRATIPRSRARCPPILHLAQWRQAWVLRWSATRAWLHKAADRSLERPILSSEPPARRCLEECKPESRSGPARGVGRRHPEMRRRI